MAYTPQFYPGFTSVSINRRRHMSGNLEMLRDIPEADVVAIMGHRNAGADYSSTHPPLKEMGEPDCPIRQIVTPTPGAFAGDNIKSTQWVDSMYFAPSVPYWRSYWAAINCRGCDPNAMSGRQIIEARERDIEAYTKKQINSEMTDVALCSMRSFAAHGHSLRLEEDGTMFDMLSRSQLDEDGCVYYVKNQSGIALDQRINVGRPFSEKEARKRTTIFRAEGEGGFLNGGSLIVAEWVTYRDENNKLAYTTRFRCDENNELVTIVGEFGAEKFFCFLCENKKEYLDIELVMKKNPPFPICPYCHTDKCLKPISNKEDCPKKSANVSYWASRGRRCDETIEALHHIWALRSNWGFRPE